MNILMTDTKLVSLDLALNPLHAEPLVLAALARSQPDLGRIDLQLRIAPRRTLLDHIGTILFAGNQCLFFRD